MPELDWTPIYSELILTSDPPTDLETITHRQDGEWADFMNTWTAIRLNGLPYENGMGKFATVISPRLAVTCQHFGPTTGDTLQFLDVSNNLVSVDVLNTYDPSPTWAYAKSQGGGLGKDYRFLYIEDLSQENITPVPVMAAGSVLVHHETEQRTVLPRAITGGVAIEWPRIKVGYHLIQVDRFRAGWRCRTYDVQDNGITSDEVVVTLQDMFLLDDVKRTPVRPPETLCAKDGDSGSPLFVQYQDSLVLIGLMSSKHAGQFYGTAEWHSDLLAAATAFGDASLVNDVTTIQLAGPGYDDLSAAAGRTTNGGLW